MKKILALVVSLSVLAFAKKDEKASDPPPNWTLEQKLAYVTAQRDSYLKKLMNAPTACDAFYADVHVNAVAEQNNKVQGIDLTKWKQNPETFDWEAIPSPQPEKKSAEEKRKQEQ